MQPQRAAAMSGVAWILATGLGCSASTDTTSFVEGEADGAELPPSAADDERGAHEERGAGAEAAAPSSEALAPAAPWREPGSTPGAVAVDALTPVGDSSGVVGDTAVESLAPALPLAGDVVFSVPSGTFEGALSLGLSTALSEVEIRYTTDGSVPGPSSPRYDGVLELVATRQIRAQAFSSIDGGPVGAQSVGLYVARRFDAVSDLPLIIVDGYGQGQPTDRDVYADMAFLVFEPSDGRAALSDVPRLATRAGWHLRGQSSAYFDQAPYRIELWDTRSEDADLELLGMPAEADWALIATWVDRSLIRNAFVYGLGRDLGLAAPRYAFAELYVNHADRPLEPGDYQGVYMVVETIKNQSERLDLAQLDLVDTDLDQLSGGYIFKFDWRASEEPTLACTGSAPIAETFGTTEPEADAGGSCWTDLEVVDPDPIAPAQAAWLTDYVHQLNDALHEATFAQYSQLIDVPSFVDVFIMNELTRNLDAYSRSAFYHKDRGQPLRAGPLWDFNLIFGAGLAANVDVAGWQYRQRQVSNDWYQILGADPEFMARVSSRWRQLRQSLLSDAALAQRIDELSEPLARAAERDLERWPVALVAEDIFELPTDPTWRGQVQFIREWLRERVAWLDSEL